MSAFKSACVLACLILSAACGTGAPGAEPTNAPASDPTAAPSATPAGTLDPRQSDAGVVGQVTISDDTRAGRDGTHQIIGLAADGSDCSYSLAGDRYTAVAWHDDAPEGQIHQMSVGVPADAMPEADGQTTGITDGGVYVDFVSESGFGTAYGGNATEDNAGSATIDVTRMGDRLVFDYEAVTWDGISFSGQMICSGV